MIGENIAKFRRNKGFTQNEFAEKIGKSERMVQKYESGEVTPSIEILNEISVILEVSINELISDSDVVVNVGENIANFRENLSISQRELGRRVGISGQMVSKIENNLTNPSLETLNKIADVLEVSPGDLMDDSEEKVSIGENIKKFRKLNGISQQELAQALKVVPHTIQNYESNRREPNFEMLNKIASILNCSLADLFNDSSEFVNVGERIKELRLNQNLTQDDLAIKASISRVAVGNYERGDRIPNAETLIKLSNALNCTVSDLIGGPVKDTTKLKVDDLQVLIDKTELDLLKPKYSDTLQYDKGFLDGLKTALQIIMSEECEL